MSAIGGSGRRVPIKRFLYRPETLIVLAATLVLILSYPIARDWGPFRTVEGMSLDWRFRLRGPRHPGADVIIAAIDDRTVAELGRWPFSRAWLAQAVDAVAADGARAIVFDLLLVGQESGGPAMAGRAESSPSGARPQEAGTDAADRALANAISRAGNVVVPFAFVYEEREANMSALPAAVEASAYRVVRSRPGHRAGPDLHPAGVLVPLASLLEAGRPAHVTVFLEPDGNLRYAHPAIGFGDAYYPSLAVEAARLFLGMETDAVMLDAGVSVAVGDRALTTDERMRLAINFAGPAGTFDTVSFIDVVNGAIPASHFRDKVVLIGTTAAGLGDRFATPYSPDLPGVEVFANEIDNILHRGFLDTSSRTQSLDVLAIAICGLLAASLGILRRPITAIAGAVLLVAAWCILSLYAFAVLQGWFNFTLPAFAILFGTSIVVAGRSVRENRLRADAERQRETLSHYLSPLTAAGLKSGVGPYASGGSQMAAVMFVDLIGFTGASETMTPAGTAQFLARFHALVERAATASHGIIDKFIGDGALVVFGVPAAGLADAANAVACARRIATDVARWKEESDGTGNPAADCGIGIHFGPVTIAELGGKTHAQITVTGDTVNVASRLEKLTRELHATIVVSDVVMEAARAGGAGEAVDGFKALPVRQIRGRDRPIGIWAWPPPAKE